VTIMPARESPPELKKRAARVSRTLAKLYPNARISLDFETPWQCLAATILSAQSTDAGVNRVTPQLFKEYPDTRAMAAADPRHVEQLIVKTGFFRQKTRSLMNAAKKIVEDYGGEVPSRMEDLVTLPGIGRKTANVILGVAFDVPGFAVDTHVTRLTNRLRLVATRDPQKIEALVTKMVPPVEWTGLSLRLILHGRRVCEARRPRCEVCVMNDFCPSSTVKPGKPPAQGTLSPGAAGGGL